MKERIIIIGASGHGKVVADIASKIYREIIFLDDAEVTECMGYPVVGKSTKYREYLSSGDFFVAIGNAKIRKKIYKELELAGATIATLIHPNAVLAQEVQIGIGTVVMAGAVINPATVIGIGCIINTCASVDHDSIIGDFVHISVGAHLAGTVEIGKNSCIGAGATIINNVKVTEDCIIGAGAVVIKDIIEKGTYVGVPVKKI
mgnify:CR=1 FL=1